jgi:hypothetical protein
MSGSAGPEGPTPVRERVKGELPKNILEKKNVFPKKYVEHRTFDGTCRAK